MLVQQATYARMRNCSKEGVRKAVMRGQIELHDGLVDPVQADRAWPRVKTKLPSMGTSPVIADLDRGAEELFGVKGYWNARARRERLNVQMVELALEKERGTLVSVSVVKAEVFKAFRVVRDMVLTISNRMSGPLGLDRTGCDLLNQELFRVMVDAANQCEKWLPDGEIGEKS